MLGLPGLVFSGLGMILGAGIYSVIGKASGIAAEDIWLAFLVSAFIALPTALSYAELATTWPRAGAEFVYVRAAFKKSTLLPFVTGALVACSGAATAATVSIAFGSYLSQWVAVPVIPIAAALVVVLTAINLIGVRESSALNVVFTIIEASGLVLVIGVAVFARGVPMPAEPSAPLPAIGAAAALAFFSFLGFENIANLAEEAKHPARDIPRAILVSLVGATVLYVLVALSATALAGAEGLAGSDSPLASAVGSVSPVAARVLSGVALFATANTALVSILVGARLLFGMASQGGVLPRAIGKVSGRKVPWLATLIVGAVALALIPFGDVGTVASVSSFASLVAFAVVNVLVVVLRVKEPAKPRPFQVPLAIGRIPLLPIFGALASLALLTQLELKALLAGLVVTAALVAIWAIRRGVSAVRGDPGSAVHRA